MVLMLPLSDTIIKLLSGFGLSNKLNLVGQGYGAAVMSEALAGVVKQIQDVAPSAVCIHCYAHRLNLVIVDFCKSVLLQQLYVYMSGLYVHLKWLNVQRDVLGRASHGTQMIEGHKMGLQG